MRGGDEYGYEAVDSCETSWRSVAFDERLSKGVRKHDEGFIFSCNTPLGQTTVFEHAVRTADHPPVATWPSSCAPHEQAIMDEGVDEVLIKKLITSVVSPWPFLCLVVKRRMGMKGFQRLSKTEEYRRKLLVPLPVSVIILGTVYRGRSGFPLWEKQTRKKLPSPLKTPVLSGKSNFCPWNYGGAPCGASGTFMSCWHACGFLSA